MFDALLLESTSPIGTVTWRVNIYVSRHEKV